MKLMEADKAIYASDAGRLAIRREWVMDPPPFIARKLSDDILINIYQTKLRYLAKVSELVSQINNVEAEMQLEVAEIVGKAR